MYAKLFARECKRMCKCYEDCVGCPAKHGVCGSIAYMETMVDIVEEWSAKNPMITNLEHVAEGLSKLGYEVDPCVLRHTCPSYVSSQYIRGIRCGKTDCIECRTWWDKEYKEETDEN